MIISGDIGFAGKRKSTFYSRAVKWFTKSRWSHNFVVMPKFIGELCVLEAEVNVVLRLFEKEYVEKNNDYYEVWRPKKATPKEIVDAARESFKTDAGEIYGFMQIPWFAARSLLSRVGINLSKNWFPSGEICSETLWGYLYNLGGEYRLEAEKLGENECSPQDLYDLVKKREDLFSFVYMRE